MLGVPIVAQWVQNPISIREDAGSIPVFTQWDQDLVLLWLWCRMEAIAPIRPLAWELPYATSVALKRKINKIPWWNLTCNVMILGGGVFEGWLGYEVSPLWMELVLW